MAVKLLSKQHFFSCGVCAEGRHSEKVSCSHGNDYSDTSSGQIKAKMADSERQSVPSVAQPEQEKTSILRGGDPEENKNRGHL